MGVGRGERVGGRVNSVLSGEEHWTVERRY